MSMSDCVYSFILAEKKYLMIKIGEEDNGISSNNLSERLKCNSGPAPVNVDTTPIRNYRNYIMVYNKLFIFRFVCQQLTEVLAEHEEVDSLEFVNYCTTC